MLKRFIRYLYEYEQGNRTRNVGFVKVEQEEAQSTVHIHGKGLRLTGGDALSLSLFFEENGKMWGVMQGEVAYMGPSINYQLRYTDEDVGTQDNYAGVEGILLETRSGRKFAAIWDDVTIDVESIRPWHEKQNTPSVSSGESSMEGNMEDDEEILADASLQKVEKDVTDEAERGEGLRREEASEGAAADMDSEAALRTQEKEKQPCRWKAAKIQRGEIAMLPRCEWRLANNHFLLHGYSNYKHLALLDDGKVLKLGVPGIYHEKEARAASGFGFTEFIDVEETKLSLNDEECSPGEQFGYWCRQVRRPAK